MVPMSKELWESERPRWMDAVGVYLDLPQDAPHNLKNLIRYTMRQRILDYWRRKGEDIVLDVNEAEFYRLWQAEAEQRQVDNEPPISDDLRAEVKIAAVIPWIALLELLAKTRNHQADWHMLEQAVLRAIKESYYFNVNTGAWVREHGRWSKSMYDDIISRTIKNYKPEPIDLKNYTIMADEE